MSWRQITYCFVTSNEKSIDHHKKNLCKDKKTLKIIDSLTTESPCSKNVSLVCMKWNFKCIFESRYLNMIKTIYGRWMWPKVKTVKLISVVGNYFCFAFEFPHKYGLKAHGDQEMNTIRTPWLHFVWLRKRKDTKRAEKKSNSLVSREKIKFFNSIDLLSLQCSSRKCRIQNGMHAYNNEIVEIICGTQRLRVMECFGRTVGRCTRSCKRVSIHQIKEALINFLEWWI